MVNNKNPYKPYPQHLPEDDSTHTRGRTIRRYAIIMTAAFMFLLIAGTMAIGGYLAKIVPTTPSMEELLDAGIDIAPSLSVGHKEAAFDSTLRDFDADIDLTEEEEADLNAWMEDDLSEDARKIGQRFDQLDFHEKAVMKEVFWKYAGIPPSDQ